MKKLEKVFIKTGFRHEQVSRKNNIAIYKRTQLGSKSPHYEIIKIGRHNGYKMGGAYIEPAETYPGNSLWGIQGWTTNDLSVARDKYNELLAR